MATATLTWTARPLSEGVTNHRVYRVLGAGVETPLITLGNVTTYADSSISDSFNGNATYTVTAIDQAGNESLHSATATKVFDAIPPGAPMNLVVQ